MNTGLTLSTKAVRLLIVILLMIPSLGSLSGIPGNGPEIIYVDVDVTVGNTGDSWAHAYNHLQDALDEANSAPGITNYEIWVAEGVYYPDLGSGRINNVQTYSFEVLYNNVQLYGGFAGFEIFRGQRNWVLHPTILSGDIDENDTHGGDYIADDWTEIYGNNAYNVVVLDGVTNVIITLNTVIDGFIITAGDTDPANEYGGGIYCKAAISSSSGVCSPTLRDLIIQGNRADYGGGVELYAHNSGISSPYLTNVSFLGNYATNNGGGMYISVAGGVAAESNPRLVNIKFRGNYAGGNGGGLGIVVTPGSGSPILTNVEFYDNEAASNGGGMFTGAYALGTAAPHLTNVTFSGNSADKGGGMYNYRDLVTGVFGMNLQNTIIWGNSAITASPTMHNVYAVPAIANSDIQGSGGSTSWGSYYGTDMGGNIDADPLFASAGTGDLTLQPGSPAIDAGDQMLLPADITDLDRDGNVSETIEYDLAMNDRVENSNVDMGAYELWVSTGDKVGLYDPAISRWFLKPENVDGGAGVTKFYYGPAEGGRLPITGDWDGDGVDTVGLYDPATSRWFLKPDNLDGGAGVTKFYYGPAGGGRLPIVGDWDGDGTDTVGLYDPATSRWFLKPANVGGSVGVTKFYYGPAGGGRLPITGDWDGDGEDTVGLYDPSNSRWFLKPDNLDGGAGVIKFYYGPAGGGRLPITGDWDADGTDTTGMYDPSNSRWFLKPDNLDGGAGVIKFYYGPAGGGRLPIAGNW